MNCLRCGKEVPTKGSFCESCQKITGQPLQQSPYLNTQIVLPTRQPKDHAVKNSKKTEKRKEKKQKPSRPTSKVLKIVCILSVAVLSLFLLRHHGVIRENQALRKSLQEEQSKVGRLEERNQNQAWALSVLPSQDVVFVEPGGHGYYHRATCDKVSERTCHLSTLQQAIAFDHPPCPDCN